jgi:hypothetical protein
MSHIFILQFQALAVFRTLLEMFHVKRDLGAGVGFCQGNGGAHRLELAKRSLIVAV